MSVNFSGGGGFGGPHIHLHHYRDSEGQGFDMRIMRRLLQFLAPTQAPYGRSVGLDAHQRRAGACLRRIWSRSLIDTYITNKDIRGLSFMALATLGVYAADYFLDWRRRLQIETVGEQRPAQHARRSVSPVPAPDDELFSTPSARAA